MWFVCAPHKQYLPHMRRFDWISSLILNVIKLNENMKKQTYQKRVINVLFSFAVLLFTTLTQIIDNTR